MSAKDRVLLAVAPHLVLDGRCAAADAIGGRPVVVAVPDGRARGTQRVGTACATRGISAVSVGNVPVAIPRRRGDRAHRVPQRSAPAADHRVRHVRSSAACGAGRRSSRTPRRSPIALIARHGPAWFRQLGTRDHPGSALVTVTGAVGVPGVQEALGGTDRISCLASLGAPWRGFIAALGAVLSGGRYSLTG